MKVFSLLLICDSMDHTEVVRLQASTFTHSALHSDLHIDILASVHSESFMELILSTPFYLNVLLSESTLVLPNDCYRFSNTLPKSTSSTPDSISPAAPELWAVLCHA